MASPLRDAAAAVVARLSAAGFMAYFVGGCVRDRLLGLEPREYDIATAATPDDLERMFVRTTPVGRAFGVILVHEAGHVIEVATFRRDGRYVDGRHPETVDFADMRADAARRDFTINGLFEDPTTGAIHDFVGGRADLEAGVVRAIGVARERFAEDHLRLLRAARFATRLTFAIEEATADALFELAPAIATVSAERQHAELSVILAPPTGAAGLGLLRAHGLLPHTIPELSPLPSDVWAEALGVMAAATAQPPPADVAEEATTWVAALSMLGRSVRDDAERAEVFETVRSRLRNLRAPNVVSESVATAVSEWALALDSVAWSLAEQKRFVRRDVFPLVLWLGRIVLAARGAAGTPVNAAGLERLNARRADFVCDPETCAPPRLLTGSDIVALGYRGPIVRRVLDAIETAQLNEAITTREAAFALVAREHPPPERK